MSITPLTNAEYFKKSLLTVETIVTFKLNLGNSLADSVDITSQVNNISDLTEKLTKSSVVSGGVILPNLKIKLKNNRGQWNKFQGYFKNGFVNNSVIEIETYFKGWTERGAFSTAFNPLNFDVGPKYRKITPSFKYMGIIKTSSCEWDRNNFIFEITIIPPSALLKSEKVEPGTLTHTNFKNICYKILNRQPFTKYLTIDSDNFEMGWDVDSIDSYADMTNKKVKDVLDDIMLLTGSIYYIDYDSNFIIEPAFPSSPSSVCTLRGNDIMKINNEKYSWENQYTGIKWDDDENTVLRKEMSWPDRNLYQYDYNELVLNQKYITDTANRTTIMENLLNNHKFLKREIDITCKWNPEIIVNKYVILDVAQEAIIGDEFLTWNEDQWNDGKYWRLESPGIYFDSSQYWKVTEIKREIYGESMKLTLIQNLSDDNR